MPIKVRFPVNRRFFRYVMTALPVIMAVLCTLFVWNGETILFHVIMWPFALIVTYWMLCFELFGVTITENKISLRSRTKIKTFNLSEIEKIVFSFLPKTQDGEIMYEILAEITIQGKSRKYDFEWSDMYMGPQGGVLKFCINESNINEKIAELERCKKVTVKKYSLNWSYEINQQ